MNTASRKTYRGHVSDDAARRLEAGTSPQMLFSNYRELVTPEAALAWFALVPLSAQLELEFAA